MLPGFSIVQEHTGCKKDLKGGGNIGVSGLNRRAVRQPNAKAISHRLLVATQFVKFKSVAFAASISNNRGGAGGD